LKPWSLPASRQALTMLARGFNPMSLS
jgi:hypothetical protein